MNHTIYPAKIILFGEYTVLLGGRALAMPFPHFTGYWKEEITKTDPRIQVFFDYLEANETLNPLLDFQKMKADLQIGISFESNIPLGYGLGSSGALCAATYDRYILEKKIDNRYIKAQLAQMEAHFHGTSSGTDPLICYLKKALILDGGNMAALPDLEFSNDKVWQFFLLDIGFPRPHSRLIDWFMTQIKQNGYRNQLEASLLPNVEEIISALIQKQEHLLLDLMHEISHFQLRYFKPMIPDELESLWTEGLRSDWFKLKLCGAGGGGFFLGMTKDFDRLQAQTNFQLILID